jgi:hypothetical protein
MQRFVKILGYHDKFIEFLSCEKRWWKPWVIYWRAYVEVHKGNHTSKISLKGW